MHPRGGFFDTLNSEGGETTWTNQPSQWKQVTSAIYKMPMWKEDTQFRDNWYPMISTKDEANELEDYIELTLSIRKKGDDILPNSHMKLGDN
eukprot:117354-Amphidinium_carterae.1